MKRVHENIKEFNNGNISFRLTTEQITDIYNKRFSDIEVISWILDEIDCYFVGDEYCLGNFDMGATIYNAYSELCYTINFSEIESVLMSGKWLKLYARQPNECDIRDIEDTMGFRYGS